MIVYFVILAAIAARFIPHMPNLAPITALAIFSGAYLPKKQAMGITLAARFISDIFLGFFSWPLMVAVYSSHLAGVLFGLWIKNSNHPVTLRATPLLFQEGNTATAVSPPNIGGVPRAIVEGGGGMNQWTKIIASSLGASLIFFLVTNFAFFYGNYDHNLTGIIAAYTNGLPFFRGTLLGDLGYTSVLFGAYQFVLYAKTIKWPKRATA